MLPEDLSAIDLVRSALWQDRGGASVMVGSGFSRNARNRLGGIATPPLWQDVAAALHARLYPRRAPSTNRPANDHLGDPLALAQQYEVAFGRSQLHRLLQNLIDDEDLFPSRLHQRLLALPWVDILTTNWDSLLERTRDLVPTRTYHVLRHADELALATRPRIIKLHGSLPSTFPLVVTSEDYRTYPVDFAPLVNTTQQSMMEGTMLLLGFSGYDPNFVHWSGWVRDKLGRSAPKIYLAGWLDLSPHERRVLEFNNVVPIDLRHHPDSDEWKKGDPHSRATEWILVEMERRTYPVEDWPRPPLHTNQQPSSAEVLSIEGAPRYEGRIPADELQPVNEEDYPPAPNSEGWRDTVELQLNAWRHNRLIYPGWLIMPFDKQRRFSECTRRWEQTILEFVEAEDKAAKVSLIYEVAWRSHVALDPMGPELSEVANGLIDEAVKSDVRLDVNAAEILELALMLVTEARLSFDEAAFERAASNAESLSGNDEEARSHLTYERCLKALYDLDFQSLEALLATWDAGSGDRYWEVRKAAVLWETGDRQASVGLLEQAIAAFRPSLGLTGIPNTSRWAWARIFADHLSDDGGKRPTPDMRRQGRQFAAIHCDAGYDLDQYCRAMEPSIPSKSGAPFDLGVPKRKTVTFPGAEGRISGEEVRSSLACYRTVRLSEVAGLPLVVDHWSVSAHARKRAALGMNQTRPELALRMLLLSTDYDDDHPLTQIMARANIAGLPEVVASRVAAICERASRHMEARLSEKAPQDSGVFWGDRLRVLQEAMSRLVVRLDEGRAAQTMRYFMDIYANHEVSYNPQIARSVRHGLLRTWETLSEAARSPLVLRLLSLPLSGVDGVPPTPTGGIDPGEILDASDAPPPPRVEASEDQWHDVVALLLRGLRSAKRPEPSVLRMLYLLRRKVLSSTELARLAQALWHETTVTDTLLSADSGLRQWVVLLLPEVDAGQAEAAFKAKWISSERVAQVNADDLEVVLWVVGDALRAAKSNDYSLSLSALEESLLSDLASRWCAAPLMPPYPFLDPVIPRFRRAVDGVVHLLREEVSIPDDAAEFLLDRFESVSRPHTRLLRLAVHLAARFPGSRDRVAAVLKAALVSDEPEVARDALGAIWVWLDGPVADSVPEIPTDLVREVGFVVAACKKSLMFQALEVAERIFKDGRDAHKRMLERFLLEGLQEMLGRLKYESLSDEDETDVPLLRWGCARLARAMAEEGVESEAIRSWISEAEEDPMPEVRNVVNQFQNVAGQ